ncbi:MAG: regulatory protein RecX [Spirosomataceae bacterium]
MQKEILRKAASFCAYQERTQREVRQRLKEWNVVGDEAEEIIVRLIEENFINEERFAKIFAGSKFRVKQWGKIRIEQELKLRGLSAYNIKKGLAEIDNNDYRTALKKLLDKKSRELKADTSYVRKQKLARFAIGRGFESDLVWEIISEEE